MGRKPKKSTRTARSRARLAKAPAASWPFGLDPAAAHGFLRALDRQRDALIRNCGSGMYVYPGFTEHQIARVVFHNGIAWLCSCPSCNAVRSHCVHIREHRFRHGDLAGRTFSLPADFPAYLRSESVAHEIVKQRHRARQQQSRTASSTKRPLHCVDVADDMSVTACYLPAKFNTNAVRIAFAEIYAERGTVDQVATVVTRKTRPSSTETSSEVRDGE